MTTLQEIAREIPQVQDVFTKKSEAVRETNFPIKYTITVEIRLVLEKNMQEKLKLQKSEN